MSFAHIKTPVESCPVICGPRKRRPALSRWFVASMAAASLCCLAAFASAPLLKLAPEDDEWVLRWSAIPGEDYRILSSSDLVDWRQELTVTADAEEMVWRAGEPGSPVHFWRVGHEPQSGPLAGRSFPIQFGPATEDTSLRGGVYFADNDRLEYELSDGRSGEASYSLEVTGPLLSLTFSVGDVLFDLQLQLEREDQLRGTVTGNVGGLAFQNGGFGVAEGEVEAAALFGYLDRVATAYDTMADADWMTRSASMVAWLADQAFVSTVSQNDDGTIFAMLAGEMPVVINEALDPVPGLPSDETRASLPESRPFVTPMGGGHPGSEPGINPSIEIEVGDGAGLPGSNRAVVLSSLSGYTASLMVDRVRERLARKGYDLGPGSTGIGSQLVTLGQLRRLGELGLLLTLGHGGVIDPPEMPGDEPFFDPPLLGRTYALQTPAPATPASIEANRTEIRLGRILPFHASVGWTGNGPRVRAWRWCITERFVRAHLQFADNAVAIWNACGSGEAIHGMRQASLDKGAGAVFGWEGSVRNDFLGEVSLNLIGLMTGSYSASDNGVHYDRAFPLADSLRQLRSWNLIADGRTEGVRLNWQLAEHSDFGLLAPSLMTVRLRAIEELALLYGDLGDPNFDSIRVYVDEHEVALQKADWFGPYEVTFPQEGPGSFGYLRVAVNGIWSNPVAISRVRGQVAFQGGFEGHGLYVSGEGEVTFRAVLEPFFFRMGRDPIRSGPHLTQAALQDPELLSFVFDNTEMLLPDSNALSHAFLAYDYSGTIPAPGCPDPWSVSGSGVLSSWPYRSAQITPETRGVVSQPVILTADGGEPMLQISLRTIGAVGDMHDPCSDTTVQQNPLDSAFGGSTVDLEIAPDYSIADGAYHREPDGLSPGFSISWSEFQLEPSPWIP